jgi:NADPH2:quinone reductase
MVRVKTLILRVEATGYSLDTIHISEVAALMPDPDEVVVAIMAAAVNPSDVKRVNGLFRREADHLPVLPGSEVAGVISAIGVNVTSLAVGDPVIAFPVTGGFASEVVAPVDAIFRKPDSIEWAEASALLAAGTTAWHLLEATAVTAGDTVVVFGAAGAVGSLAVQLAQYRGATVVGTVNADGLSGVAMGPHTAIVESGPDLVGRLRSLLPDGASAAVDTTGSTEAIDASVLVVEDPSRIATISGYQRAAEVGIRRLGFVPGGDPGVAVRNGIRQHLVDLAGSGLLEVRVARTLPLADAAHALSLVRDGHTHGKIVIVPAAAGSA